MLTKKIETPISSENAKTIVEGIIESENRVKLDYNIRTVRKAAVTVNGDNSLHFLDALIAETMIENKKISGIRAINPILSR